MSSTDFVGGHSCSWSGTIIYRGNASYEVGGGYYCRKVLRQSLIQIPFEVANAQPKTLNPKPKELTS